MGMGISLVATFISVIIIGEKLHLYYLNTQNAKDSNSLTSNGLTYNPYIPQFSKTTHPPEVECKVIKEEDPNNRLSSVKVIKLENLKHDEGNNFQSLLHHNMPKGITCLETQDGTLKMNEFNEMSPTDSNASSYNYKSVYIVL